MAELLVLEFSAPDAKELYYKVSRSMGIDASAGTGDWPAGILSHVGGESGGNLVVVETWESKAAQEKFMADRLGPALQQAQVPEPKRVEWFTLLGKKA